MIDAAGSPMTEGLSLKETVNQIVRAATTSCPACDCPPAWALLTSGKPLWDAEDESELKYDTGPEVKFDRNLQDVAYARAGHFGGRDGLLLIGPKFMELDRDKRCKEVFAALGKPVARGSVTYLYRDLIRSLDEKKLTPQEFFGPYWQGEIDSSFEAAWADFITDTQKLYDENDLVYRLASVATKLMCESYGDPYLQKQAEEGFGLAYDYCKFPPGVALYHTTVDLPSVKVQGLKTRSELSKKQGEGLGGGPSNKVSVTSDKMVADSIVRALVEAVMVLNGQITVDDLLGWAEEGYLAKKPYIEFIKQIEPGAWLEELRRGRIIKYSTAANGISVEELPEGGELIPPTWTDNNGKTQSWHYSRPGTPEELRDINFRVLTRFLSAREWAGGTYDPLFAYVNLDKLSQVKLQDIGQMTYTMNPDNLPKQEDVEGLGKHWLAMNEVRLPSGGNLVTYKEWLQKMIDQWEDGR